MHFRESSKKEKEKEGKKEETKKEKVVISSKQLNLSEEMATGHLEALLVHSALVAHTLVYFRNTLGKVKS
jgi:hypothetical protein